MKRQTINSSLAIFCIISIQSFAQVQINLVDKLEQNKFKAVNRGISVYELSPGAVEMNAKNSDGLGILEDLEFDKGIIEIELLGENNPGKSFIGIAFNIQNDSTTCVKNKNHDT